jgi:beta-lactamase class C
VNNFRNEIAVFPEADLGICVLLNSNSKLSRTVIPDLYQIVEAIYRTPEPAHAPENDAMAVREQ